MVSFSFVCLLTSLIPLVAALDIKGTLATNDMLSDLDLKHLGHAKVILDDGAYSSPVTRHGHFNIPHVKPGTYILQVLSPQYQFEQLRIDVSPNADLPEVRPYLPGTPLDPPSPVTLPYPLTLHPTRRLEYFAPVESFNLVGMFKSPMMLMMGVTVLMVLGVPYLMKNLDPEIMKEVQEQQAKMAKMQNTDLASGLSGLLNNAASATEDNSSKAKPKGKRR